MIALAVGSLVLFTGYCGLTAIWTSLHDQGDTSES